MLDGCRDCNPGALHCRVFDVVQSEDFQSTLIAAQPDAPGSAAFGDDSNCHTGTLEAADASRADALQQEDKLVMPTGPPPEDNYHDVAVRSIWSMKVRTDAGHKSRSDVLLRVVSHACRLTALATSCSHLIRLVILLVCCSQAGAKSTPGCR